MRDFHKKVNIGKGFDFLPTIVQAKPILAIPKKKKKNSSQYRVLQENNKQDIADPNCEPRLFIECEVHTALYGSSKTVVFDVENGKAYKITVGTPAPRKGTSWHERYEKQCAYLKEIDWIEASSCSNYDLVKDQILENTFVGESND